MRGAMKYHKVPLAQQDSVTVELATMSAGTAALTTRHLTRAHHQRHIDALKMRANSIDPGVVAVPVRKPFGLHTNRS